MKIISFKKVSTALNLTIHLTILKSEILNICYIKLKINSFEIIVSFIIQNDKIIIERKAYVCFFVFHT